MSTMTRKNGALADVQEPPAGLELMANGAALQQMRTQYATAQAIQRPRSIPDVSRRLLEEAALAEEDFYYGWGAGKDLIEGPSIKLALAAARCWGNCAVDILPVQDLADSWVFTASFVDLETGFTLTRQFRQSKNWTVHGKLDAERKADIRFQIGQSKAIRNVVLNAVPASLTRKAMERAKEGVLQQITKLTETKGMAAIVDASLRELAKVGVPEARVLGKLAVADKKAITVEHLVTLKGDLTAIRNGQEWPESLFPEPQGVAGLAAKLAAEGDRQGAEGGGETPTG